MISRRSPMISRRSYASRSETNFQNSPFLQHPARRTIEKAPRVSAKTNQSTLAGPQWLSTLFQEGRDVPLPQVGALSRNAAAAQSPTFFHAPGSVVSRYLSRTTDA